MSLSPSERTKLLHRIRRIRGQFEGIEQAIEQDKSCSYILQSIAAVRGAVNGFLVVVIEDHIQSKVFEHEKKEKPAVTELVRMIQLHLK